MLGQSLTLPVDLGQPAAQILVLVFFLIPGLITTWAVERLLGNTPMAVTERLLRAIAWSVLLYAMASPWLVSLGRRAAIRDLPGPWEPILGFSFLVFVAPIGLALMVLVVRRGKRFRSVIGRLTTIDPSPTPWDAAFRRGGPYLVRIELDGGGFVGGFFGQSSVASAYPQDQQVFLEQAWVLADDGTPLEPLSGSRGILVSRERIRVLELLGSAGSEGVADGEG